MTDNELLGEIQDTLESILEALLGGYSTLAGGDEEHAVDDTTGFERDANANARGIVVANTGDESAYVYENDNLIGIVPAGESWKSPTDGTGEILITTKPASALATTIHLTTLNR